MISRFTLVRAFGALVLAAAFPSVALAHGDSAKTDSAKTDSAKSHQARAAASQTISNVQGTVEAISRKDLTVKDVDGHSLKVQLNEHTQFDNSGKSGALSDLRAGMSVAVRGEKQKDGTLKATAIRYDKSARADTPPN
jgi:hypothetical protein